MAELADIDVPLETWTHDVAFLHRPASLGKFPAAINDVINCYFRPEGSALILAAGKTSSLRGEPPDAEDQTPTPTFLEKLIDQMIQRIPKIEESGLHSIHVGRDGITPDQRAIYGPSGLDGFYLACGLSGTGFKTSPARAPASWSSSSTARPKPWTSRPSASNALPVSQEEVFGPFVTVTTFRDDEEVIAIANGTEYGLGGGLWTTNLSRAHRVAAAMRAGMVWINCYKRVNPGSPFGGVGRSGYGREMGFEAMHDYTEAKSVWVNVDAQIPPYYPR